MIEDGHGLGLPLLQVSLEITIIAIEKCLGDDIDVWQVGALLTFFKVLIQSIFFSGKFSLFFIILEKFHN